MAKRGKEQQKHVASKHVTTRRLARWQQEKRRQRITFLSGIVIIVIVLGIIVGGVAATRSSDWLSKVQTDSGTITIKKADYANELRLFQVGIYNASTMTNESPLSTLEDGYLINDKAKELGLNVSKAEIDKIILAYMGMANQSISDLDFNKNYQNMLGQLGTSDKELRDNIQVQMLGPKLIDYYINQTPTSGPQVNVSLFTISNISTANELAQKWRNGETTNNLSKEYGNKSQTGWLPKGYIGGDFDNVAFTIDMGNVSDPIPSETGYYVIQVLDRKDDTIPDSMRQMWGYSEFNTWYQQDYTAKVKRNPDLNLTELHAWALKQLS